MQQTFDILLPEGFSMPEKAEDMQRFIETLFTPDSKVHTLLGTALQYENKPKFGPSTISNISFIV